MARQRLAGALVALVVLAGGCGGSGGVVGTYTHPEEGTITLSSDGEGTWTQEGNAEPFSFQWSEDGSAIVLSRDGEEAGRVRLEDGNLVLPPDLISGDADVTFERE